LVLDPGSHTLVAKCEGYEDLSHTIDAKADTAETLRIDMVKAGSGDSATIDSGDSGDDGPNLIVVVAGGVIGLGAIGGGVGLLVAASGKTSDREDLLADLSSQSACSVANAPPECAEIQDLGDQENTFSTGGAIMLAGGGVVLAATALYAFWPRGGDEEDAPVGFTPVLGPSHAGFTLSGTF
jgi:hypothetical protein